MEYFGKAKTASEEYINAQNKEETEIGKYSNEIESYIDGNRNTTNTYKTSVLYDTEINTVNTTVSFKNGQSIENFDAIKFVYGQKNDSGYYAIMTAIYDKNDWNIAIDNNDVPHSGSGIIGLYGYTNSYLELDNISYTGFRVSQRNNYVIIKVYGINY